MFQFTKDIKLTRVLNAVAAGTTNQTGSTIDMADFDAVSFTVAFGTITNGAVTTIRVQQGAASDASDMTDLAGTSITVADTDDNKLALTEIFRPQKRYVRVMVARATQNAVIDGAVAFQYGARVKPVTQDSTTIITPEFWLSPAEGTA